MTQYTKKSLLAATCPHGRQLGKCEELWCRSRAEDLTDGEHEAALPELPEPEDVAS